MMNERQSTDLCAQVWSCTQSKMEHRSGSPRALALMALPRALAPYLGESPRPHADGTVVEQRPHRVLGALGQGCSRALQRVVQGRVSPIVHGVGTDAAGQEQLHDVRMASATGQVQGPPPVLIDLP